MAMFSDVIILYSEDTFLQRRVADVRLLGLGEGEGKGNGKYNTVKAYEEVGV
jgi:hypothetical protein